MARAKVRRATRPEGFPRGKWHPELVGVIINYPKTQEAYDINRERGRVSFQKYFEKHGHYPGRKGVPDGWGKRSAECKAARDAAAVEAKDLVRIMKEQGHVAEDIDPRAQEALEFAVAVVRAKDEKGHPAYGVKEHLTAARLVLDFTRAKPASTANINLQAETFLEELAKENPKE